jgi:DNA-binding winged helix-turn-helix (wHTH) protein
MKNPADHASEECFHFGRYVVHQLEQAVSVDGTLLPVEPRVFALLWYLISRRPHIVRTDELIEQVWSGQTTKPARVAQSVAKARKAVGDDARAPTLIRTIYGVGYQFVGNPSQPAPVARK